MLNSIFTNLHNYNDYLSKYPFHKKLGIDLSTYGELDTKNDCQAPFYSVDPDLDEAFPAELDDLIRLHYLVIERKITTILEFGVGKSTAVFDHALQINKECHFDYVSNNLRRKIYLNAILLIIMKTGSWYQRKMQQLKMLPIIIQTALFQHLVTVSAPILRHCLTSVRI